MSADGPEQREANRLERDTYDHDERADRADERERSPFADMIFETAKLNMESYRNAHAAGFEAGHTVGFAAGKHEGYMQGIAYAKSLLTAGMPVKGAM